MHEYCTRSSLINKIFLCWEKKRTISPLAWLLAYVLEVNTIMFPGEDCQAQVNNSFFQRGHDCLSWCRYAYSGYPPGQNSNPSNKNKVSRRKSTFFTIEEVEALVQGVRRHGPGRYVISNNTSSDHKLSHVVSYEFCNNKRRFKVMNFCGPWCLRIFVVLFMNFCSTFVYEFLWSNIQILWRSITRVCGGLRTFVAQNTTGHTTQMFLGCLP